MKKLLWMAAAMMMATAVSAQTDKYKTFTVNGVNFKMIKVEGGTFRMGYTDQYPFDPKDYKPAHDVTLSTYYIGETEVTQALWRAVMGSLPSEISSSPYDLLGSQRPVCYVSWEDCQDFISKLNALTGQKFHLPTEAQWEFAAREGKRYGNMLSGDGCWRSPRRADPPQKGSKNVKSFTPNALNIYDMSGNVYEWCQDWYGMYREEAQTNPTGPSSEPKQYPRRVIRGGSWSSGPECCRVWARFFSYPSEREKNVGLRLAQSDFQEVERQDLSHPQERQSTVQQVPVQGSQGRVRKSSTKKD